MRYPLHLKVPSSAARGEVVKIQTKLHHPMESGWRTRQDGTKAPKALAGTMSCTFNDQEVFRAEMDSGTASDPYLAFYLRIEASGLIRIRWTGQEGQVFEAEAPIAAT